VLINGFILFQYMSLALKIASKRAIYRHRKRLAERHQQAS